MARALRRQSCHYNRSRYTAKYPNSKTDLRPRVWRPASSCSFFERKVLRYHASFRCQRLFCNCFSAMAKSAYHDARWLPFLTSITDLASVVGDYFEDYCVCDHRGGLTGWTSRKQVRSEQSVIDFLGSK